MGWKKAILIPFLMVSAGCVETIVMDPYEKDYPVVVNCILQDNRIYKLPYKGDDSVTLPSQSMRICYAKGKSVKDYLPVEDAIVYTTCRSDEEDGYEDTLSFYHVKGSLWESVRPMKFRYNTEYTLHVEIPGRDAITAKTTTLPQGIELITKTLPYNEVSDAENDEYVMKNPFICNNADKNSVLWVFAEEYTAEGWKGLPYITTNHPNTDEFSITERKFSELSILGEQDLTDEGDNRLQYLFNIVYGAFPDNPLYEDVVRIDRLDSEEPFFLYGGPIRYLNLDSNNHYDIYYNDLFDTDLKHYLRWPHFIRFLCHFVSPELDEYLRSIYVHNKQIDSYLSISYSTSNIYSNINGGLGIFGFVRSCAYPYIDGCGTGSGVINK